MKIPEQHEGLVVALALGVCAFGVALLVKLIAHLT
jgi:hypothetical protein